jgi:tRNA (cmo5U34)-methyltransferase
MSVASHLNIRLDEYDARIRTFIPGYSQMLAAAARSLACVDSVSPTIVDLGTGTGALASACVAAIPGARLIAVDEDPGMLAMARQRLGLRTAAASFVQSSFLEWQLPECDAVVASLALHHVRTTTRKQQLYRDIRAALGVHGIFVSADCFPSTDARLAAIERDDWHAHLRLTYSDSEADGFFAAWAAEDVYVPLEEELSLVRAAGFAAEVWWRQPPMAVIVGRTKRE